MRNRIYKIPNSIPGLNYILHRPYISYGYYIAGSTLREEYIKYIKTLYEK